MVVDNTICTCQMLYYFLRGYGVIGITIALGFNTLFLSSQPPVLDHIPSQGSTLTTP